MNKYTKKYIYSFVLGLSAFITLTYICIKSDLKIESPVAFTVFIGITIFTIYWGFRENSSGYTSLDRIAQIASILIFGILQSALINAIASFIWPLLSYKKMRRTLFQSLTASFHNSGMFIYVILISGYIYELLGGQIPLTTFTFKDILFTFILALTMQITNTLFMIILYLVRSEEIKKAFSLFSSIIEMASFPMGIFTALVYNLLDTHVIGLFVYLLIALILVVWKMIDTSIKLRKKVDELSTINKVERAISSSLMLDNLVQLIYEECKKLMSFSIFYIVLYDDKDNELEFKLYYEGDKKIPSKKRKFGQGIVSWIIESKKPILVKNWDNADRKLKEIALISGNETKSFICVPMVFEDNVLGVISVQSYEPYSFDESHLEIMTTFAYQCAIAITNARLYSELDEYKNELEKKVEEQTQKLLEVEKTKAVVEMAGAAAHEVSQPLTSALGTLDIIFMKNKDKTSIDRNLLEELQKLRSFLSKSAEIIHKIQQIKKYVTKEYAGDVKIIDIDKASERDKM
jgi:putative methionine-R-sulfoxide reductase with GAF domain